MNYRFTATTTHLDKVTEHDVREQAQGHIGEGLIVVLVHIGEWSPVTRKVTGEVTSWEADVSAMAMLEEDA